MHKAMIHGPNAAPRAGGMPALRQHAYRLPSGPHNRPA